jgi:predicted metalloprotease
VADEALQPADEQRRTALDAAAGESAFWSPMLRKLAALFFALLCGVPVSAQSGRNRQLDEREKPEVQFVSFALDDIQKTWDRILPEQEHIPYRHAKLVLFRDEYPSACGEARRTAGPFYCPGDEKVYLDLGFFRELKQRFGAPGEFAQAYVIAHEIGHHVQKLLGIETRERRLRRENPGRANQLSVRLELQADCLAGVWANSTHQRNLVDQKDIGAAIRAAAAVGDDRLQRAQRGYANPETFTHGTSAQRVEWFRKGFDSGKIAACNTL